MDSSICALREAKEDELEKLISKAEQYLPNTITIYGMLTIGFRRNLIDKNYTKLYIPIDEDLPFFIIITGIVIKPNRNNMTAFWDPKEIPTSVARSLLTTIPDWDWKEPSIFYCTSLMVLYEIKKIILGKEGLSNDNLYLYKFAEGYSYKFSEDSLDCEFPETEYELGQLTENEAPLVHAHWMYNFAEDVEGIRRNIEQLPSMAAFEQITEKSSNDADKSSNNMKDRKPVSWAVARVYGEIGYTFTFPEHRRKGLSAAVTREIARKLLEQNISPFVSICENNSASEILHKKIGFKKYCPIGYQTYLKNGMDVKEF